MGPVSMESPWVREKNIDVQRHLRSIGGTTALHGLRLESSTYTGWVGIVSAPIFDVLGPSVKLIGYSSMWGTVGHYDNTTQ